METDFSIPKKNTFIYGANGDGYIQVIYNKKLLLEQMETVISKLYIIRNYYWSKWRRLYPTPFSYNYMYRDGVQISTLCTYNYIEILYKIIIYYLTFYPLIQAL